MFHEIFPSIFVYNHTENTIKELYFKMDKVKYDPRVKKIKPGKSKTCALPTYNQGTYDLKIYHSVEHGEIIEQVAIPNLSLKGCLKIKVVIEGVNEDGTYKVWGEKL